MDVTDLDLEALLPPATVMVVTVTATTTSGKPLSEEELRCAAFLGWGSGTGVGRAEAWRRCYQREGSSEAVGQPLPSGRPLLCTHARVALGPRAAPHPLLPSPPQTSRPCSKVMAGCDMALQLEGDKAAILSLVQRQMDRIAPNLSAAVRGLFFFLPLSFSTFSFFWGVEGMA